MLYLAIKYLHVLGAIVILGTGTGIAFFMLMAHRSGDAAFIAKTAEIVVTADSCSRSRRCCCSLLPAALLMWLSATAITEGWLMAALALYVLAGLFWVPVIFMQIAMRDLARAAVAGNAPLPPRYFALFRTWFLCGIPGFGSVMAILWLMIAKPF